MKAGSGSGRPEIPWAHRLRGVRRCRAMGATTSPRGPAIAGPISLRSRSTSWSAPPKRWEPEAVTRRVHGASRGRLGGSTAIAGTATSGPVAVWRVIGANASRGTGSDPLRSR